MKFCAVPLLFSLAVTIQAATPARRLSSYEYNATIRDLLGVDAGNFSSGVDNNGDTLTVTPALLKKYLDAAKKIARSAIEPVPPPATPELERDSNSSSSPDITWHHTFTWEGDYDAHIAIAGRNDPFALYLKVDDGEPQHLSVSVDFEGRRYADTRVHLAAGLHRLRIYALRDDDRAIDQAWGYEVARAKKAGKEPAAKSDIRARLINGTLRDYSGAVMPPYPEYIEARGPYGLVFPAIPPGYDRVFTCGHPPGQHSIACVRKDLADLARRAWRRPVSPAEIDTLLSLVAAGGQTIDAQMETGLEAILVSPSFLFRIEQPDDDFALASRLSYFLWSSIPDDELFHLAEHRQLSDPAVLAAQARRMLADPKANALAENFAAQWLEFRNLDFIHRDPARYSEFTADLRDAMRRETELFVERVIHDDRGILDFLDAKYTFVNEPLARLYGIPGVTGDSFRQVDLTGTTRAGILTQASVLTVTSYATRTSPVLRGKWILENLLNDPPPPPPANVPALRDPTAEPDSSLRHQLEQHRSNPACAGCHSRMDTLGFGMENFDAIGRWRTREETVPIDASGKLPDGESFSGASELAAILAKKPEAFARCLTEKLLVFALGRGLDAADHASAAAIARNAANTHYKFSALVIGIVTSPAFRGSHE